MRVKTLSVLLAAALAASGAARKTLDMYFIDTEGGQATLLVAPTGESMLIDAGWPGNNYRDAGRIVAAARAAGLQQIDYLLVTHYHLDHVGGVPQLMERFPVRTLVDHGENTETSRGAQDLSANYKKAAGAAKRMEVKTGDKLRLGDVEVLVVSARGDCIKRPLDGAGKPNPICVTDPRKADDPGENARSIGVIVSFGKFRFVDLGDLTWNKELELVCPSNLLGNVDLYLTTHHGLDTSGPKSIVHALAPRVAIMNNGARKGGSPAAWKIVSSSPGLQDLWQLHSSVAGGTENNVVAERIANLEEKCEGHAITVAAERNRSFSVRNSRNGLTKTYKP
jgi:beta-lactamase superfamily II metal-dependent hydrolase